MPPTSRYRPDGTSVHPYGRRVNSIAAVSACVLLAALAVFQLALIAGAPIGRFAWGGQNQVLPPRLRVGSVVSIVLYAVFAMIVLDRAAVIDVVPDPFSQVGTWIITAYLALGVIMNAISRSKAERYTMTPVALVLAALFLVVAIG